VVDDTALTRQLLREVLRRRGYTVVDVQSGDEAVAHVQEGQCDVVLMDVQMPIMDGLEATRRIRRLPNAEGVRIIGLTANALPADRERCLRAGMDECLTKPIDWTSLLCALSRGGRGEALPVAAVQAGDGDRQTSSLNRDTMEQLRTKLQDGEFEALLESALGDAEDALGRLAAPTTDPVARGREAHSLQGTSAFLGLRAIRAVAAEIEQAVREGRDVIVLIGRLRQTLAATRAELRQPRSSAEPLARGGKPP